MERTFLYIDILGFEDLVRSNSQKVDRIFEIFNNLKVHKHFALQTVVFSDTILVFNKEETHPTHYYCTYLIEYAQALFYKLSAINVYFKGILTVGEFNFSKLSNIQAYYGLALIDAYKDETKLEGFGLYVDSALSQDVVVFDKVPFGDKYEFVLLCQSLKNLYSSTNGILPIDIALLYETDAYHRIEDELRFFREIEYIKQHHPSDRVKRKYQTVYDIYKNDLPIFFETFENEGFMPFALNAEYVGSINPYDLLSERELSDD